MNDPITEYPAIIKRKEDEIKDLVKEHALPFLPAKTLLRLRLVSKYWDQRIMHPFLAHKQSYTFHDISGFFCQFNNSGPIFVTLSRPFYGVPSPSLGFLPENQVAIRSSCNGLLLCKGSDEDSYYICNPVNKEWASLPRPEYYHGSEPAIVLGFEPSVLNMGADYQVICSVELFDHVIVEFDIYSSKTKQWRHSSADCVELDNATLDSNGFYIKGVAYWLTSSDKILAFDLTTELVQILYLPSESAPGAILADWKGELGYVCALYDQHSNAYMFEFYGGMDMSLKSKTLVKVEVDQRIFVEQCQILAFLNNNVLFFVIGNVLFSYQMSDQTVTIVSENTIGTRMRFLPYVNSLVNVAKN